MSQDVSPGIAKELTSPRKNAQIRKCTQDWSPETFSAVPAGLFLALAALTQD